MSQDAVNVKLFIFGLDRAGKTTSVEFLRENKFIPQQPTLGVNVTQIVMNKIKFNIVDVGGQKQLRKTWADQIQSPNILIFVVDGSEPDYRLQEARDELHRILALDKTKYLPLLILQNKIDLPVSKSIDEIEAALELDKVLDRPMMMYQVSAKTGENFSRALTWITSAALADKDLDVYVDQEIERRVASLKTKYKDALARAKQFKKAKKPKKQLKAVEKALEIAKGFYEIGVFGGMRRVKKLTKRANKLRETLGKDKISIHKALPHLPKFEPEERAKPDFGSKEA